MTRCWTLEEVAAWKWRWPELGRDGDFLHPHPHIWPEEAGCIPGLVGAVHGSLAAADRRRFNQAVLASLALSPRRRELIPLLHCCLDPAALGLPFSLEQLAAMDWIRVPTLLADRQRGVLRYVLLGRGETGKRFRVERMDRAAAEAVELALELAGLPDAFVWPVVEPDILGPALHGDSLALPVALGAWLSRRGEVWPEGLVCTGGLTEDGRVSPVDNVPVKARTAAQMGFRALLYPERSFDPNESLCPGSLTGVGVQTLDEAQTLAACFHPDHAPDMVALYRRRHEPGRVPDAVLSVPSAFLDQLSEVEPGFREALATACLCPESAAPLLDRLHGRMADRSASLAGISRLAQRLFPLNIWRTKALESPGIGIAVARLHVEAANHQGLLHEFAAWEPVLRQACARLFELRDARGDELLAAPLAQPGKMEEQPVERDFGSEDAVRVRAMFATAFDELGFGGKTAVGYGRFIPMDGKQADSGLIGATSASTQSVAGGTVKPLACDKPKANPVQRETWKNALLSYLPNTGEIRATAEGKKAVTKDKSLVPDVISGKLFGKKKQAQASVVVEPRGNAFALVEIKEG